MAGFDPVLDQATLDAVQRILFVGDLHANAYAGVAAIQRAAERDVDLIIQVGDFGFWPDQGTQHEGSWARSFVGQIELAIRELEQPIPLLWIPGNHENWREADAAREDEGLTELGLWETTGHISEAHPGVELGIWDKRFLFVGGAVSLDRYYRTPGHSWFPQERISDELGAEIASRGVGDVDVIVAHDAPAGVGFLDERYAGPSSWLAELIAESHAHQRLMRTIFDARLREGGLWVNGHHHARFADELAGRRIEGLGRDGDPIDQLTMLLDLNDLP